MLFLKPVAAVIPTLPALFSEAKQKLPRIRGYASACAISGSTTMIEPRAKLSVMVAEHVCFYGFVQAFDRYKVSCWTMSGLQPLRKAPCTARAHTIIVLRMGEKEEQMHYQRLKEHRVRSAS